MSFMTKIRFTSKEVKIYEMEEFGDPNIVDSDSET